MGRTLMDFVENAGYRASRHANGVPDNRYANKESHAKRSDAVKGSTHAAADTLKQIASEKLRKNLPAHEEPEPMGH
jgi:hypothetical protein